MISLLIWFFYETNIRTSYTTWVCIYVKGWLVTSIHNMEKRYCKRCNSTKDADLFYEDRKYCMRCLDKEKEKHQRHREKRLEYFEKYYEEHKDDRKDYRKAYSQIEIECEVCKCTVRKCNLAKHILTKKHIKKFVSNLWWYWTIISRIFLNKIYPRIYFWNFGNIFWKKCVYFFCDMYGGRAGLVYEVGRSVLLL